MLQSTRWQLLGGVGSLAGGSLQHACSLLADAAAAGAAADSSSLLHAASSSSISSGSAHVAPTTGALLSGQGVSRSISTTRSIYMGRVFIRENLQKRATKSSLFSRENYQFLADHGWSLAACEQILSKHQAARPASRQGHVGRQLDQNIKAAQSLEQLQGVVTRHSHQMNTANLMAAVQQTTELLNKRDGSPDYAAAALLMNQLVELLRPKLASFNGSSLCNLLASFGKCRYAPSAELLQEVLQLLMDSGGQKLGETYPVHVAHLLLALSKLTTPQGHWPIMVAIRERVRQLLQQQLDFQSERRQTLQNKAQQLQRQLDGSGKGGGSGDPQAAAAAAAGPTGEQHSREAVQRELQQTLAQLQAPSGVPPVAIRNTNALALCAYQLDKTYTSSPEYLADLHAWMSQPFSLLGLYPNAAAQLWGALKGQWAKHETQLAAAAAAAQAAASGDGGGDGSDGSSPSGSNDSGGAAGDLDAALQAASAPASMAEQQRRLEAFFGSGLLSNLAAASVQLVPSMTERELGSLLNALGRLRYSARELLAASAAALSALGNVQEPSLITQATALWAAAQMELWDPALVMPALVAAATQPEQHDGYVAARVLIATSQMPAEVLAQHQLLLRQELHRRSGARGPPPTAAAAADGAAASTPLWVSSLADSLAGRIDSCRPREIAYILLAYSEVPGVPLHEGLFGAAARHIEQHTHTFTAFRDMEMVATAFERMRFKDGLPALEALQKLSSSMMVA